MSGWRKGPPGNVPKAPPSRTEGGLRWAISSGKKIFRGWRKSTSGTAAKAPSATLWGVLRKALNPVTIILVCIAALFLELNFQYYDYKGEMAFSPLRLLYKDLLPDSVTSLLRGAGKFWGGFVHGRTAVTLLPDHVMLCVPKTIEWENPAPNSPEEAYKMDVESIMRIVARQHAQPGVTFDENGVHYEGGGWIAYVDLKFLEIHRAGDRRTLPMDLREYWSVGTNHICGNTFLNKEGPEHYRAYAYTFEGRAVPAWK